MNKSPTISIATVVKNEARNLGDFFKTIEGFADELVIVDTGSSDNTLELIKQYSASASFPVRIYDDLRLSPYHHGKAKNNSIGRATCDYIFILDADERLSDGLKKNLKAFLNKHHPKLVSVQRVDEWVPHLLDPQQRVLLREANIRYKEDGGAIVHCEFVGGPVPLYFDEPMYHFQGENHWLVHPSRFKGQLKMEALGVPNTRGLLRETVRGIVGFYYKFRQIYIRKEAYKDGWRGFAYACLKGFYGVLLHISIGLKPRERRPSFGLRLFVSIYLLLSSLGARHIPKVKGFFYAIYGRWPKKSGVVRMKTVDGNIMYIDLADPIISLRLLEYGYWEKSCTDVVRKLLKPGMRVVDVGAHAGYYTVLFAQLVGRIGSVTSFEPDPYNFSLLEKNVAVNGLTQCTLVNRAVSNQAGSALLYHDPRSLGSHSLITFSGAEVSVPVQTVRLDDYFASGTQPIDLMKIDIEGYELLALEGARETLAKNPDVMLIVEFNGHIFETIGRSPKEFFELLRSLGFAAFVIENEGGKLHELHKTPDAVNDEVSNLLCIRDKGRLPAGMLTTHHAL